MRMQLRTILALAAVLGMGLSQTVRADVTAGFDFFCDASQDTDGDQYWEDLVAGNPSGLGLRLDDSPAVARVSVSGSVTPFKVCKA